MRFASLQNFGSRWGPYSNKMLWSWEALGRWCPDALDWCCLLDDEFQLDSGTFLFLCNWNEKKRRKKKARQSIVCSSVPTSHSSLSYCIPFLSRKLQTPIFTLTGHPGSPSMTADRTPAARTGRKEAKFGVGWGHNQSLGLLLPCCGLNTSFTQMHISWQCWAGLESRAGLLKVEPLP